MNMNWKARIITAKITERGDKEGGDGLWQELGSGVQGEEGTLRMPTTRLKIDKEIISRK